MRVTEISSSREHADCLTVISGATQDSRSKFANLSAVRRPFSRVNPNCRHTGVLIQAYNLISCDTYYRHLYATAMVYPTLNFVP